MNSCVLPPHKNHFQLSNIKWCKYLEYFKFSLRFVLNGLCKTKHEYINIFNFNFMVFVCEVFVYLSLSLSPVVNTSKQFGIKEKEELHQFIFEFSLGWLSMWYLNHWLFKRGSIDRLFIIRMHIVTWTWYRWDKDIWTCTFTMGSPFENSDFGEDNFTTANNINTCYEKLKSFGIKLFH